MNIPFVQSAIDPCQPGTLYSTPGGDRMPLFGSLALSSMLKFVGPLTHQLTESSESSGAFLSMKTKTFCQTSLFAGSALSTERNQTTRGPLGAVCVTVIEDEPSEATVSLVPDALNTGAVEVALPSMYSVYATPEFGVGAPSIAWNVTVTSLLVQPEMVSAPTGSMV